ncbi:SO2930 family diheme c-type cytochrome [Pseudoxanthomonas daejeonensis]|uniref:SO2930 family diheme c-type cytochrome n=1 Tax=Pseudoxanthomonas daejeonensis TaxID=266062 RepID=UPI001EE4E203|nr:SO2930 family diheme c-type cytochrome [Pseudoxanthomonas daejeonensis]
MVDRPSRGRGPLSRLVALAGAVALAAGLVSGCRPAHPPPVAFHAEGQPESLSEWHLFDMADGRLELNERVLPYDLNSALFTDYAHKLRTVWMPEGTSAHYDANEAFDFPVGTIISKTFYYPRIEGEPRDSQAVLRSQGHEGQLPGGQLELDKVRLLETRLLVRRESGWVALPYVWNAEQTEARLMRAGDLVPLTLVDASGSREEAAYQVPDQNQCAGCHVSDLSTREFQPIGPKARHLNRDLAYPGVDGEAVVANQLAQWQRMGYLDGLPEASAVPRVANWQDAAESVDARARAYLDINCSHCHSAAGPGNTSGLWLASDVSEPLRLGRCKLPIAAGHGTGDRRFDIVPGKPDESILTYRMISTDPGVMMPELGRSVTHAEGVELIREWIAAQHGECGNTG